MGSLVTSVTCPGVVTRVPAGRRWLGRLGEVPAVRSSLDLLPVLVRPAEAEWAEVVADGGKYLAGLDKEKRIGTFTGQVYPTVGQPGIFSTVTDVGGGAQ